MHTYIFTHRCASTTNLVDYFITRGVSQPVLYGDVTPWVHLEVLRGVVIATDAVLEDVEWCYQIVISGVDLEDVGANRKGFVDADGCWEVRDLRGVDVACDADGNGGYVLDSERRSALVGGVQAKLEEQWKSSLESEASSTCKA